MKSLIELVLLFSKSKFKAIGLLAVLLERGSQMERLFDGIASGTLETDEQALAAFPEFKGNKARLATLKSKLQDRLHDAVLLLDFNESAYNDRQKAFYECSRKYASAMVLLGKGLRKNGVDLLEATLRQALRFEFTSLAVDILLALSMHTALDGEVKKTEEYQALKVQQEELMLVERKVEQMYKDLTTNFVRKKSGKDDLEAKAREFLEEVKPYTEQYTAYRVQLFGRLMEINLYDSMGDYKMVAQLAEEGLAFFSKKTYKSATALQALNYHLLVALFNLREYDRSIKLSEQYSELYEEGTYNWFKLQEVMFLGAMHARHYEEARDICASTIHAPKYESQPAPIREIWKIFEAYIAYLVANQTLPASAFPSNFRLQKFLNEVPVFGQDKSGMNVTILVAQCLHYLSEHDEEKCLKRVDALVKYRTRYLNHERTLRSYTFFRMLEGIAKAGFQAQKTEQDTLPLLQFLQAHPPESANQNHEIEVIPYERLWKKILNGLAKK